MILLCSDGMPWISLSTPRCPRLLFMPGAVTLSNDNNNDVGMNSVDNHPLTVRKVKGERLGLDVKPIS